MLSTCGYLIWVIVSRPVGHLPCPWKKSKKFCVEEQTSVVLDLQAFLQNVAQRTLGPWRSSWHQELSSALGMSSQVLPSPVALCPLLPLKSGFRARKQTKNRSHYLTVWINLKMVTDHQSKGLQGPVPCYQAAKSSILWIFYLFLIQV